ncbi:Clan AD, family A22, presenilin-like aspartic peptidase [Histomonas meleagridis]|uniref:Clan AD, family A22, presenilin-like aspartic peptidase n=1 Tax=Histomonas meleagridis TaxID=135588 RepID=UPI003559C2E0|nr:Clan AD, family A22, presenilin-like aspartic peptidase [Histomonas meleagridis]KAH0796553.1 Clan AD, family A22, presenilin-like aspartic peptidase [Histomonas meleagridis]
MKSENEDITEFLEDQSYRVIKIAIPVIVTLIFDVILTRVIENTHGSTSYDRSFSQTMVYQNMGIDTATSIYLALGLIGGIIIVTAILLLCYYHGCTKVIYVWMIIAVTLILSYYVYQTFSQIPAVLNIPTDYLSGAIFILNLVVVGNMSIFWRAPQIVTQIILIFISVLIAIVFLSLPDWTVWILLALLVIYDCCVVLCPFGLLNMLIKKSEERGDEIPALVYASAAYHMPESNDSEESNEESESELSEYSNDSQSTSSSSSSSLSPRSTQSNHDEGSHNETEHQTLNVPHLVPQPPEESFVLPPPPKKERDGVRLGLGDFCFYGILITRAARQGWDLTILCIFAVILGLSLTLLILAWLKRPLPALPLSLILGIIFFMIGALTFRRFDANLNSLLLAF